MTTNDAFNHVKRDLEETIGRFEFTPFELYIIDEIGILVQCLFSLYSPIKIEAESVQPDTSVGEYFGNDLEQFEQVLFHFIEEWEKEKHIRLFLTMKEDEIFDVFTTVEEIVLYFFLCAMEFYRRLQEQTK